MEPGRQAIKKLKKNRTILAKGIRLGMKYAQNSFF